jgi:hypothetical protein
VPRCQSQIRRSNDPWSRQIAAAAFDRAGKIETSDHDRHVGGRPTPRRAPSKSTCQLRARALEGAARNQPDGAGQRVAGRFRRGRKRDIDPRQIVQGIVVATLLASGSAAEAPNVITILADDLGYGDVSANRPGADIQTPQIDRLAREGMRFTMMRANCTVCSPSRAALMTGGCADRVGVPGLILGNPENSWGYFDPTVPTLASTLHRRG